MSVLRYSTLAALAVLMCAGSASARGNGLGIVRVAHFDAPVYATPAPGEPGRLYVVQQAGQIVVFEAGHIRSTPFLDIRPIVLSGGEQGLLSVAFDPDYAKTHRFYVDYTDRNGDTHVVQYRSNGVTAIPSSARQLLFVKDFASNHNGGQLQFGPDGWLYWGNGDGGGGGDPQHNGQNLNRPFAKIMRLDVNAAKPRWKLVAFGLRNPWRFSFDRKNGDLYIGDVGQDQWEEVDYLRRGAGARELRLEPLRGDAHLRRVDATVEERDLPPPGRRVLACERRLLGDRRLRVPRHEADRRDRPLLLRRLLLGKGLEPENRQRPWNRYPPGAVHGPGTLVVRSGLDRRAVPDVGHLGRPLPPALNHGGLIVARRERVTA